MMLNTQHTIKTRWDATYLFFVMNVKVQKWEITTLAI